MGKRVLGTLVSSRKRRIVLGILLFLLVLIATGSIILHTKYFKSYLLEKASNYLQKQYKISFSAESLNYSLLRLSVVLDGVEIKPLASEDSSLQLFSAKRLLVNIPLSAIFSSKLHLQQLSIYQPQIVVTQHGKTKSDSNQLKQKTTAKAGKSTWLQIDEFDLTNGILNYQNRPYSIQGDLLNIEAQIRYSDKQQEHWGAISSQVGEIGFARLNLPINSLLVEFRFDSQQINLDKFSINTASSTLRAAGWLRNYQAVPSYNLQLKGSLQLKEFQPLFGSQNRYEGPVGFTASIQGKGGEFNLEGSLTGQDVTFHNIQVARLEATIQGTEKGLSVSPWEADIADGSLAGKLDITLSQAREYSVSLDWQSIDLAKLAESFPQLPLIFASKTTGRITANWQNLDINEINATGDISFDSQDIIPQEKFDKNTLEGHIRFEVSQGEINIPPSYLSVNRDTLTFSASLDKARNLRAQFMVKSDDLSATERLIMLVRNRITIPPSQQIPALNLAGSISISGNVTGSLVKPVVSLNLEGAELRYRQLAIDKINAALSYRQERLSIASLLAVLGEGRIEASGYISYEPPYKNFGKQAQLDITLREVDIEPVVTSLPISYVRKGIFSGNARLSGNLFAPTIDFDVALSQFTIEKEDFPRLEAAGSYQNQSLTLNRLKVFKGDGTLEGNLRADLLSRSYSVSLVGEKIDLQSIKSLEPVKNGIGGELSLRLEGSGTFEQPQFSLRLSAERLRVFRAELQSLELKADSDGKTVQFSSALPEAKATLQGSLQLTEPFLLQGKFSTTDLHIEDIIRHIKGKPLPPFTTELTTTASFSLPLKKTEEVTLALEMQKARMQYHDLTVQNSGTISLKLAQGEIDVQQFHLIGSDTEFSIYGKLPLTDERGGSVKIDGRVNLRLLQPFVEDSQVAGIISLKSEINGSLERPHLNVDVELSGGALTDPRLPYKLHNVALHLLIDENSVRLESFTANLNNGSISAQGSFSLASLPFELPQQLFPLIDTEKNNLNHLKVTVANLDLGGLAPLMGSKLLQELQGTVDGEINLRGSLHEITQLELEGKISRLLLSISKLALRNDQPLHFSLKEGTLSLEEARFSGEQASVRIAGDIDLIPQRELDVRLSAELDHRVLGIFVSNVVSGGVSSWELSLKGPLNNPTINGIGEIKDGFFQLRTIPVAASNVTGRIEFSSHTITLSSLQGVVNGGPFNLQGKLNYSNFKVDSAELRLSASNVQLNYPEGLFSQSNATILLEGKGRSWLLSGDIKLLQALYRENIYPGSRLISSLLTRQPRMMERHPATLQNLRLDIGFSTIDSIIIDNNMADLEMYGDLRITGTGLNPIVSGRISMRHTGVVVFGEHRYQIERAIIDFLGTEQLDPHLDVVATTKLRHKYDELEIKLTLSGPLSNLTYSLSSFPPRSEEELASLLITGRGLDEVKSETADIIGKQMLLYFASPVASPLTKQLQRLLRVEEVTIEPINIATEEDPGARFTFTKRVSDDVAVTYSIDVSNSQLQTWLLDYNISRNFSIRSFRRDDGSYGSSFRHRFAIGSKPLILPKAAQELPARQLIKGVELEGDLLLARQIVSKKIRPLKIGSPFDYRKLYQAMEDLIALYKNNGYLNAVITPTIKYENNRDVYITLHILPQKPVSVIYAGDPLPKKLKKRIIDSWDGRLLEDTTLMEAKSLILDHLQRRGFYDAAVRAEKRAETNRTTFAFYIRKGPQYRVRNFTVRDNKFINSKTIRKLIKGLPNTGSSGLWALIYDFGQAKEAMESLYEDNGFLKAVVNPPQVEVNRQQQLVDIVLTIEEGPQSRINSVEFKGNEVFSSEQLPKGLQLITGRIFRPYLLSTDRNHLFNLYRTKGYQEVEIEVEVLPSPNSRDVNIVYNITEGIQHIIAEIEMVGNQRTPDYVILRELKFKKGDVLNLASLSLSQKRLYDTGIFNTVQIYSKPLAGKRGQDRVIIEIQEKVNFAVTYGLRYNSELKLEGFGELSLYNIFGRGRNGLIYYRQNNREKDLRLSLKDPYLLGRRLPTIYSFYYNEMIKASFVIEEIGFSVQQQKELPHDFSLSYLYSFHKIHTYNFFDFSLFLSKLSTFLVRDTRDFKMDPQRGSFFSVSFTYSPEFLGSDLTFISIFGQVSFYQPLFSNVVWASNYRVGLADAFDQVLIPSERFFTGGGNSIRGFERDMVGPLNPYDLTAEGGEALFIMNQELRFPIHKWLRGVAFYDMGNVYSSLSDFNPFDARHSIGFGLRLDTRFSLIRLDYGINLFPRPGEPRGVFFFSIGQAF